MVACKQPESYLFSLQPEQENARQVLLVEAAGADSSSAVMYLCEMENGSWTERQRFPVRIGRNGLANGVFKAGDADRKKKEGDGCSPAGEFPLLFAFGKAPAVKTLLPYKQVTIDDICVDDPNSDDYNLLVKQSASYNQSHEKMYRNDHQYDMGVWIGYNHNPEVSGNGSCIFMHIWLDPQTPTSGCTAMSEENMRYVLSWLDPGKNPVIIQRVKHIK